MTIKTLFIDEKTWLGYMISDTPIAFLHLFIIANFQDWCFSFAIYIPTLNNSCLTNSQLKNFKKKNTFFFFWMGFNCLKARAISRRQFILPLSSQKFLVLTLSKDERLSWPWSHPVVWTRDPWTENPVPSPLGQCYIKGFFKIVLNLHLTILTGKNCVLIKSVQEWVLGYFRPFQYV